METRLSVLALSLHPAISPSGEHPKPASLNPPTKAYRLLGPVGDPETKGDDELLEEEKRLSGHTVGLIFQPTMFVLPLRETTRAIELWLASISQAK